MCREMLLTTWKKKGSVTHPLAKSLLNPSCELLFLIKSTRDWESFLQLLLQNSWCQVAAGASERAPAPPEQPCACMVDTYMLSSAACKRRHKAKVSEKLLTEIDITSGASLRLGVIGDKIERL